MKLVLGFIYRITNKVNGKVYIGQTINSLKQRFHRHINSGGCKYLHNAILRYGKENFVIEEIERISQDKLDEREIYWIKYYNSTDKKFGYNIYPGGNLGNLGNYKLSPQQISEIVAMEERKVPHTEIAEQFGINRKTVTFILKREIEYKNKRVPLTDRDDLESIKKFILSNNPTMAEVCSKFRISRGNLKKFTDSFGYKFPTHSERLKARI